MSGLALMLMEMGHRVSGCDRVTSTETERLQSLGLSFSCPHSADAVSDAEIVIYSSAIREDNPALSAARKLNIPCMRRAECLAAILNGKKGVVVSGTHGKTTTSALCAHLMREGRMRPCHYVGAEIPVLGTNAHWNEDSEYLVAEGDESDGTLVNYIPEHSIVLNIEPEHLDHYKDLDEIKAVFDQLCSQTRGMIIYCRAPCRRSGRMRRLSQFRFLRLVWCGLHRHGHPGTPRPHSVHRPERGRGTGPRGAGHSRTPQRAEFPGRPLRWQRNWAWTSRR